MSTESIDNLIAGLNNAINDESIPSWAVIIISCSKEILNQLKEFRSLNHDVEELKSAIEITKNVSDRLIDDNERMRNELNELRLRVDDNEQRNRNFCLLLHGVQESPDEKTDDQIIQIINSEMDINLSYDDIHRSHRLGSKSNRRITRSNNRTRPIIFRLISYRKRQEIFYNKRKLKGKDYTISENLTKYKYDLLKESTLKLGKGKCWTVEGRIITKLGGSTKIINSSKDIDDICESLN